MSEYQWEQAARVRCLRSYLGMTVNQMAETLNVGIRSYQNFESGRAAVPQGVLDDLYGLVDRLDDLAEEYEQVEVLNIADMGPWQLRAAGMAAARNRGMVIIRHADHRQR